MIKKLQYTNTQTAILVLLRLVIGYHFLFEGMDKLFTPHWSAAPFLLQANWLFSDFFIFLANSDIVLIIVNFSNIWGQIFIGIGLILGLFSRTAAIGGAVMLAFYYIAIPPFMGGEIFIDKNLLEFFGLLIIAQFPYSNVIGLDSLIEKYRSIKNGW